VAFGPAAPPRGPQVRIVRGDNADPLGSMGGADGGGKRYAVELYAQAYNALNHFNALNFSGVVAHRSSDSRRQRRAPDDRARRAAQLSREF
jgi:hypothetical protein